MGVCVCLMSGGGLLHPQFLFRSYTHTHVMNIRSWRISSRWTALNAGVTHWIWVWLEKALHSVLGHCVRRTCLWALFSVCVVVCKERV